MSVFRCLLILILAVSGASAQLVETNVALDKPTVGDVAYNSPTANGNDGNTETFNHADNVNDPPDNPYWEVELEGAFDLIRIEIVDRIGCCDPNRLNGSEIRLFDENSEQIGATIVVDGLQPSSPTEAVATLAFDNNGAGWSGVARVRIDGYTQYFQFSEFRAISLQPEGPPQPVNVARYGLATASGELWTGHNIFSLIDGNAGSHVHPLFDFDTLGFTYTVDLFSSFTFERLELLNRADCCPDRLSNYRVSLHEDDGSGEPGPAVWAADLHTDGDNAGEGGIDVLTAELDPDGVFAGRFIVVENLSDGAYNPQIAELRAFSFDPAPLNLAFGKPVELYDSSDTPVPTWSGFPASRLVDGFLNTISHPLDDFSEGYYYQIDLEAEVAIGEVRLSGRLDGCCPERLSNFLLEILDGASDSVFVEEVPDQVTLPVTMDIGNVTGRYLRIINAGGASYSPQVGEVAVFPPASGPPPASDFWITGFTLDAAAGAGTLTFTSEPGATYVIFGSSDLKTWSEIKTNVSSGGANTTEAFTDPALANAGASGLPRFYRVEKP